MERLDEMRVLLMQEVVESSLPKGGKLILLDLIALNEDLDQATEILEAFEVINEKVGEKVKAWLKKHKDTLVPAVAGTAIGTGIYLAKKRSEEKKTKKLVNDMLKDVVKHHRERQK